MSARVCNGEGDGREEGGGDGKKKVKKKKRQRRAKTYCCCVYESAVISVNKRPYVWPQRRT